MRSHSGSTRGCATCETGTLNGHSAQNVVFLRSGGKGFALKLPTIGAYSSIV
jgi:hypothetical protein